MSQYDLVIRRGTVVDGEDLRLEMPMSRSRLAAL